MGAFATFRTLQKRFQFGQLGRSEIRQEIDEILLLLFGELHGLADTEFDRIPDEYGLADGCGKHDGTIDNGTPERMEFRAGSLDILDYKKENMSIILGIDPGTTTVGFAVLKRRHPVPEIIDY